MVLHLLSLPPPMSSTTSTITAATTISHVKAPICFSRPPHCCRSVLSLSPRQLRGFRLSDAYLRTSRRQTQRRRRGEEDEDGVGFCCSAATGHGAAVAWARPPSKPKEHLVLGNPSVRVEKGKYSYEVETLIDKLSSLPPRGSIARCLESFKNRLSLNDFALVFKEFARRGDWQRSLRLFKYIQRQSWCRPNEHIHAIVIGVLGREGLLDNCLEIFDHDMPAHAIPRTALSYTALINAFALISCPARLSSHLRTVLLTVRRASEYKPSPTRLKTGLIYGFKLGL